MSEKGVIYDGFPTLEEIKQSNGWPTDRRFAQGPVAVIECVQEIPCNPCEGACPTKAIHIGTPITTKPTLEREKCTGCGLCVAQCSGLAIFVVDKSYSETEAAVSFPFEYYPLPEKGSTVEAVNRACEFVCSGTVVRIVDTKKNDHTPVITIAIPKEFADSVRSIKRPGADNLAVSTEAASGKSYLPDDVLICRCEEITAGEIRQVIAKEGVSTITGVKRRVRAGMGLCQGKTCGRLVTRLIAEQTGKKPAELLPSVDRPPVRPVSFAELGGGEDE